ncbi:bifunctional hydroxymethylpyrimidine kinase/phosphomethylpyrimidine kinase [Trichothermofontia sp.]
MTAITIPIVLTIAGSDSGGGAGIQADLRTFACHGVHGTSALTCVTAQNTIGVSRVDALSPEAVVAQIEAVSQDMAIGAVKTGMLLNADIIKAVAESLVRLSLTDALVVDPVMVSRAGVPLIDDAAVQTLRQVLLPLAQVLTPNRYEAQILAGQTMQTQADMERAARHIQQLGPKRVLVKGGGMAGDLKAIDVWYDGDRCHTLSTEVVDTPHTHGTGCTLSAAITANLALGYDPLTAAQQAKHYVTTALKYALAIGRGQGPVGHFFPLLQGDHAHLRSPSA